MKIGILLLSLLSNISTYAGLPPVSWSDFAATCVGNKCKLTLGNVESWDGSLLSLPSGSIDAFGSITGGNETVVLDNAGLHVGSIFTVDPSGDSSTSGSSTAGSFDTISNGSFMNDEQVNTPAVGTNLITDQSSNPAISIDGSNSAPTIISSSGEFRTGGGLGFFDDGSGDTEARSSLSVGGPNNGSLSTQFYVYGSTSLDGGLIYTDGSGNLTINGVFSVQDIGSVYQATFSTGAFLQDDGGGGFIASGENGDTVLHIVDDGISFFNEFTVGQQAGDVLTALSNYGLVTSPTVLGRSTAIPAYMSFSSNVTSIVSNQITAYGKATTAATIIGMQSVATSFTCISNPTFTLYDCGTSAGACTTGRTALAAVTLTAANMGTDGSVSSSALAAGHYWAVEITGGTCTSLNIIGTAQYN